MLDLSRHSVSKNIPHWFTDVNQLYHPTGKFAQDSQDLVYSRDVLNSTKFVPILVKEWFYLVEKEGYLVIDYQPNAICDWDRLEKTFWWLWKQNYKIIFHGPVSTDELDDITPQKLKRFIEYHSEYFGKNLDSVTDLAVPIPTQTKPSTPEGYLRFVCQKTSSTKIQNDSIDKWTFGIITNGKRRDWIDEIIAAIESQGIPNFEIVICGSYQKRKEIKYIPFNERDDRGWITKKKNLIVQKAKYENICIIHDRIVFQPNWYEGMKKWGNTFDHLACTQQYKGMRINDWEMHEKLPGLEFSFVSLLDYRDWDINGCQGGQLHISKKQFLIENPWDESLLWKEAEDLKISNTLRDSGHILRCNPDSGFSVYSYAFGDLPSVPYDAQKLSPRRKGSIGRLLSRKVYKIIYTNPTLKKTSLAVFDSVSKYLYAR